jgi:hypothetical protein
LVQRFAIFPLLFISAVAAGQQRTSAPLQVFGGYSWLSNSFNGVPGSQKGLNGWNAGVGFPPWRHLRFQLDYSMYRGTNAGNPQRSFFIMGGGQYEAMIHRERIYAEGLVGEGGLNGGWFNSDAAAYRNGNSGSHASLAEFLGGGIDTPISHHAAIRVEGGVQHSNFVPIEPFPYSQPYHLAGIPNYFGRFSVGMVWLPHAGSGLQRTPEASTRTPVESELIFEGQNSFGHFHIFANSWWSYLSSGGIEYDRHSWGSFIGARVDYSAEILPVLILRQPSKTDVWGNPGSSTHETVPGVGISPLGMRLLWFDGRHVKPYYDIKLGITGYTKKTFSQYAAYENFSLQQTIGVQLKLTDRWDFRSGLEVFHQSDGFAVPSNPGLDEMMVNAGFSYHLGHARSGTRTGN